MTTIVEPKAHIDKLWGKQKIKTDQTYRLMRYVLRVDYEGKVLLHNVVTGQLIVLSEEEARLVDRLPQAYSEAMDHLVVEHYLVPEDYYECQQVKNLRVVLSRLDEDEQYSGITTYTILTTTACNARCYYCYEQGSRIVTMTEQTANDVVNFIDSRCGSKRKVFLTWFGGEPTLASNRIAQICEGLRNKGIQYESKLVSNGYLFDEQLVAEAKSLWNLKFIQICVDGTENNYNRIKAYIGVTDNPYQRVMHNTWLLLNAGIRVKLRMNFDIGNYKDFVPLLEEVKQRFKGNTLLQISSHPIIGVYPDHEGNVSHGSDEWFEHKMVELFDLADSNGFVSHAESLPSIAYRKCMAARDYAVTITPEGFLVRCPEQFSDNQITGTLKDGITNQDLVSSWKQMAEKKECANCILFPECYSVTNCLTSDYCVHYSKRIKEITMQMLWQAQQSFDNPL